MSAEQILVVGAGPTGLTLACLLWQAGTPCRVIDAAPEATARSRAIGVSARSLEVLDELGIADRLVARGLPSREAVFYSGGRPVGRVTASATRHTRFPFLLAVPQSATEAVLQARLDELGGRVERGTLLRGLRHAPGAPTVSLTLDGAAGPRHDEAHWVVGADGAHSVVRKDAGISFSGGATGNVFANVDARLTNGPTPGVGHYFFSRDGMLVIAPLPEGIYRITASLGAAEADGDLTLGDMQELVERRSLPGIAVRELMDAGWGVAHVRIQARIATAFRAGRCLLAGDAAHIYGPTGAQGMNAGIQDAQNLAWKLGLVGAGRAPESLLDSYSSERRTVAAHVLRHVEQQTRLATVRSRTGAALRDVFLRAATRSGMLDRGLGPRINQLDVTYRADAAAAARGQHRWRDRCVGRRVPNVSLRGPNGDTRLFPILAGQPLTVLATCAPGVDTARVAAFAGRLRSRYGDLVAFHPVWRGTAPAGDGTAGLADPTGTLHELLSSRRDTGLSLIRRDQHVAARADLTNPFPLFTILDSTLLTPATAVGAAE
jgi:2-polyprenyl-6-methoxyphenol hydroxylase-like FAD-dependent oxidoreductase